MPVVTPENIGDPGRAAAIGPGEPTSRAGLADIEISSATSSGMRLTCASVRGILHRRSAQPRQDAFAIGARPAEGEVIAVVCDGVGSLGRSDEAASLASRRLTELRRQELPWPEAFATVNAELRETAHAARAGENSDDRADGMATTAVALAVCRDGDEWAGQVAWVGDSALLHLSPDGTWASVTHPFADAGPEAGFHTTAVSALPSGDGTCATREFRLRGGALFLMSDGVANPLAWSSDVREQLAAWWAGPADPLSFAAQVGFARRTHMDDRTVVGIWVLPADEMDG